MAYLDRGNSDGAIADIAQVIQRYPTNVCAYASRGFVYLQKGDFDRAIADYTRLIDVGPFNPSRFAKIYRDRGIAYLIAGSLLKSLDDLNQASVRNPKDPYTALWLEVVTTRSNLPSHLAEATAQLDMTKWPAPIVRLFLGETTPEEVFAAADDADANKKKGPGLRGEFL